MRCLPIPVVLLVALLSLRAASVRWGRVVLGAAAVLAVAVAVVWLSYLVVDPGLRWSPPADLPHIGGLRGLVTSWLPLPQPYRDGMLIQLGYEDRTWGGYLFGRAR